MSIATMDEKDTVPETHDDGEPIVPFDNLSADQQIARQDLCKEINEQIKRDIQDGQDAYWRLARHLHEFHVQSGWSALGYPDQQHWLEEAGITGQEYFTLRRMYRVMVVDQGIPPERLADYAHSKLRIALPAIEDERAPVQTVLADVENLSARELRERYVGSGTRGKRGGPPISPEPSSNGAEPQEPAADAADVKDDVKDEKRDEVLVTAVATIDSFLTVGGRKKPKAWENFITRHPVMVAATSIGRLFEGDEGAPDKDEAVQMWRYLVEALHLNVESV